MRKLFSLFSVLLTTVVVMKTQSMFLNMDPQEGGAASSLLSKFNEMALQQFPALQGNKELQEVMKNMPLLQNGGGGGGASSAPAKIRYEAPEAGIASIKIHDLSGMLVRTVHHYNAYAGPIEFVWDGKDDFGKPADDGQYFYQVRFGDKILTKRLSLVK